MCRVTTTFCITIDPYQPVFCTVTCYKVLEIVSSWDSLGFCRAKEVLCDTVVVVAERDLDWALEAM